MSDRLVVPEDDLEDVYRALSDATDAAAAGDPNECASRAADAKAQLVAIHSAADPVERWGISAQSELADSGVRD